MGNLFYSLKGPCFISFLWWKDPLLPAEFSQKTLLPGSPGTDAHWIYSKQLFDTCMDFSCSYNIHINTATLRELSLLNAERVIPVICRLGGLSEPWISKKPSQIIEEEKNHYMNM